jgi:DNA-binding response OmpR family regulator
LADHETPTYDPNILRGVSILVVEDAWHVAKAMKGLLEQLGMNVWGPVATTTEARRLISSQTPRIALVDVNLKGELGWELIDDLRERCVDVIVISGYLLIGDSRVRALTCLQKPYEVRELKAALYAILVKST